VGECYDHRCNAVIPAGGEDSSAREPVQGVLGFDVTTLRAVVMLSNVVRATAPVVRMRPVRRCPLTSTAIVALVLSWAVLATGDDRGGMDGLKQDTAAGHYVMNPQPHGPVYIQGRQAPSCGSIASEYLRTYGTISIEYKGAVLLNGVSWELVFDDGRYVTARLREPPQGAVVTVVFFRLNKTIAAGFLRYELRRARGECITSVSYKGNYTH
jgi:hypothetical protein